VSNSLKEANSAGQPDPCCCDHSLASPKTDGRKFRAAHTFANAKQISGFATGFGAGGIDPTRDIELLTVALH